MNEQASLADITFTENGHVEVAQLNALYRIIGWDQRFGFRVCKDVAQRWERGTEAISKDADGKR